MYQIMTLTFYTLCIKFHVKMWYLFVSQQLNFIVFLYSIWGSWNAYIHGFLIFIKFRKISAMSASNILPPKKSQTYTTILGLYIYMRSLYCLISHWGSVPFFSGDILFLSLVLFLFYGNILNSTDLIFCSVYPVIIYNQWNFLIHKLHFNC